MKQCMFVVLSLLFSSFAMADNTEPIRYFSYADQLIRQYHHMTGEALPPVKLLATDLFNASPGLRQLSFQYLNEKDAFNKRAIEGRLTVALQESMKEASAKYIAIYWQVQVQPYDFEKKQFSLCFGWYGCLQPPLYTQLGTRGYEISAKESPLTVVFSPEEKEARLIESIASKTNRRMNALIVFQPLETKEIKTSNGGVYRKIIAAVSDIYLLKYQYQDADRLISPENIVYKMSRLK